jgi:hypothetical protein
MMDSTTETITCLRAGPQSIFVPLSNAIYTENDQYGQSHSNDKHHNILSRPRTAPSANVAIFPPLLYSSRGLPPESYSGTNIS